MRSIVLTRAISSSSTTEIKGFFDIFVSGNAFYANGGSPIEAIAH
jgi:hypothetical protein